MIASKRGPAVTEQPLDRDGTELAAAGACLPAHVTAAAGLVAVQCGSAAARAGHCPGLRGTGRQRRTEIHL